jgi:BirA family transcriptional regulator, biotin operon repressor / biotin---[acetyl-CoA-carboxylase] ligase
VTAGATRSEPLIEFQAETGSTSADIATRLRHGERVPEGHWLVADRQTAGKGRHGREWFDGAGNFMGSTVVHRAYGDPDAPSLALAAGLAVYEAVASRGATGAAARLKWPNDVMIGKAKLGGILLEKVADSVIVGIGVNLAVAPVLADRETIALDEPDRNGFAADLARLFAVELDRWRSFGLAPIIKRWLAVAHSTGTALAVGEPGEGSLAGIFAGLTEDGALLLHLADGETRVIHAGEVRLI